MGRTPSNGATTPTLVRRAGDWGDHSAWLEIDRRFAPLLLLWCRKFRFDPATADELTHRILIRVSERLPTFEQKANSNFRGWLWSLFRSRALDLLKEQRLRQGREHSLETEPLDSARLILIRAHEDEDTDDRMELMSEAEAVTAAVRSRTQPENWDIFWKIEIEGWTIAEAAELWGKSHAAAYQAHARLVRRLKEEAARRREPSARTE